MDIKKGSRVKVFDHRLYDNDITTPLDVTMKEATVVKVYQETKRYKFSRLVADVIFDYRPNEISKAHFVNQIVALNNNTTDGAAEGRDAQKGAE